MNNQKSFRTHNQTVAEKDPLQGAPGHQPEAETSEQEPRSLKTSIRQAPKSNAIGDDEESSNLDQTFEQLSSVFGAEKIQKFRDLVSTNAADAETYLMSMIRSLTDSLPKGFKLPDLSWPTDRQMKGAAAAVAGVGGLFLLREYINRNPSESTGRKPTKSETTKSTPAKRVAGANRTPSSAQSKKATKGKATKKSSVSSSGKKRGKTSGKKSKTK